MPLTCDHPATAFYRRRWADGEGYHVVEACLRCRANVRGPGVWVPRSEVQTALEHLADLPDPEPAPGHRQRNLFED